MSHLPFHQGNQPPANEGEDKVHDRGDCQAFQAVIRLGDNALRPVHQVGDTDDRHNGGLLDDGHELVAQRGKDVFHGLRQNDQLHGFSVMEAQTAGRFHLALIHGLNAGTDDLRHIGAAIQAHGHDARRKAIEIRDKADAGEGHADHGQTIEDEHQLHHQQYR